MLQVVQQGIYFAFCNKFPVHDAIYLNKQLNVTKFEEQRKTKKKNLAEPRRHT